MSRANLLIQGIGDVTVVGFNDPSILEALMIQRIGDALNDLVEKQDKRKLILDFSNVRFLSSMALGMLLSLKKKADAGKGKVVLCGLKPELDKVFKLANLHRLFSMYPDETKALAGFDVYMA